MTFSASAQWRRRRRPRRRGRSQLSFGAALGLICLAIAAAICAQIVDADPLGRLRPVASLGRYGLISGRFVRVSRSQSALSGSGTGSGQQVVAAVFLGIPYAAAPIGPLRFMPTAAAPATTQLSARSCPRAFVRFAPTCVRLDDWLPVQRRRPTIATNDRTGEPAVVHSQPSSSEECLNVNVYVPLSSERLRQVYDLAARTRGESAIGLGGHANDEQALFMTNSMGRAQDTLADSDSGKQSSHWQQMKSNYSAKSQRKQSADTSQRSESESYPSSRQDNSSSNNNNDSIIKDCSASNDPSNPSERLGNNNNINFWPMRDEKRTSHSATAVKGLPVLVRVGNYRSQTAMSTGDDNEMLVEANAKLASSLDAIVVDFEHRSGLLGFLPVDDTVSSGQSGPLTAAPTATATATATSHSVATFAGVRQNHAIWDQIGALHWLKRNIANFNGNQNNVTLVASDNRNNKYVQLLVQTPLAKGLFKRAILVHDSNDATSNDSNDNDNNNNDNNNDKETATSNELEANQFRPIVTSLRHLLDFALDSRELKKRLLASMISIVKSKLLLPQQNSTLAPNLNHSNLPNANVDRDDNDDERSRSRSQVQPMIEVDERSVFERIQSFNLSQLALIETELHKQIASNPTQRRLFALATEPNLDDPILFPHLYERLKRARVLIHRLKSAPTTKNKFSSYTSSYSSPVSDLVYDTVLFPTASYNRTLRASARTEVSYCLYMRSIGKDAFGDTLALLPRQRAENRLSSSRTKPSQETRTADETTYLSDRTTVGATSHWHRDSTMASDTMALSREQRRHLTASEFEHLRQVHLLKRALDHKLDSLRNNKSQSSSSSVELDDEDEIGEDSLAHRQQFRAMLMNSGGYGTGSTRRKRGQYPLEWPTDTTPKIPLGSINLLLGYIGAPARRRVRAIRSSSRAAPFLVTENDNVTSLLDDLAKELDDSLITWLKLADANYLSNFAHNRTALRQLCEFGTNIQVSELDEHKSFVFVTPNSSNRNKSINKAMDSERNSDNSNNIVGGSKHHKIFDWISDPSEPPHTSDNNREVAISVDNLRDFVHFGNPNPKDSIDPLWPSYNSLGRPLYNFIQNSTSSEFIGLRSSVSLDLMPYLRSVSETSLQRFNHTSQSVRLTSGNQNSAAQKEPIDEWLSCLADLNIAIGRWRDSLLNQSNSLAQFRLREEAQCLASSELRLRLKVRRSAFDDLETLLLSNGSFGSSTRSTTTGKSNELLRILHEASSSSSSKAVLVATRNLAVGDSNAVDPMDSFGFGLEQSTLTTVASNNSTDASHNGSTASTSGPTSSGLKGFFAKAYKDAIGKALAMVVGTGLMIFMLNLIIVLVISVRSRQSRRRCAIRDSNSAPNSDDKHLTPLNRSQQNGTPTVTFDSRPDHCPAAASETIMASNQMSQNSFANLQMHLVGNSYSSSSTSSATSFRATQPNQISDAPTDWHKNQADISFVASSAESNSNSNGVGGGSGTCKRVARNKQLKFDLQNAPKRHDDTHGPILANRYNVGPHGNNSNNNNNNNATTNELAQQVMFHAPTPSDNYVAATMGIGSSAAAFKLDPSATMAEELNLASGCQHQSLQFVDSSNGNNNNSNSQSSPTTNHTTNNSIINSINTNNGRQPATGVPIYSADPLNYGGSACLHHQCETAALLSATSPSSSTTLSLTPMQLEQLVVQGPTTTTSSKYYRNSCATNTSDACDFQIEPIGFLCTVSQQPSAMSSPNDPIGYGSRSDRLNFRPM